jgi:hypothetical protein
LNPVLARTAAVTIAAATRGALRQPSVVAPDGGGAFRGERPMDPTVFATHHFVLGDTMRAYDTFVDAATTNALKVVLEDTGASRRRTGRWLKRSWCAEQRSSPHRR